MGDVIGDLSSRRGQISSMDRAAQRARRQAQVPLSEDVRIRWRPALQTWKPLSTHGVRQLRQFRAPSPDEIVSLSLRATESTRYMGQGDALQATSPENL